MSKQNYLIANYLIYLFDFLILFQALDSCPQFPIKMKVLCHKNKFKFFLLRKQTV